MSQVTSLKEHVDDMTATEPEGSLDIELRDLYASNGKYTPEQKVQAVMAYMVTGTSRKASKICDIPEATIRWWKASSSWWQDVMSECRRKKQDELDAAFTNIIELGTEGVEDRLKNGNTVIDKHGDIHQIPMSGKDIAWILGVIFDKRQLLRGDPTSRVERITEQDRLDKLQRQFEDMYNKVNAKEITNVEYEEIPDASRESE